MKFPSDTTIYTPALARMPEKTGNSIPGGHQLGTEYVENIANFVEHMQHQQEVKEREERQRPEMSTRDPGQDNHNPQPSTSTSREDGEYDRHSEAKRASDKLIIDAEIFRVSVEKPSGKDRESEQCFVQLINPDDEFFHLTCHIDKHLIEKVQKGQFVELEKLLPGDRFKRDNRRLEFCYKDGATFLTPAERERRITNVRRWDQAFHIYASIYCHANPSRTSEIWQYMEVIHTAAAAYIWENVARYDNIFRQLMEYNPKRSWAVTYTHMWNLTLVEPLQKNYNNPANTGGKRSYAENNGKKHSSGGGGSGKKSDYCWALNGKSNHCHFGDRCQYINKCSYCD